MLKLVYSLNFFPSKIYLSTHQSIACFFSPREHFCHLHIILPTYTQKSSNLYIFCCTQLSHLISSVPSSPCHSHHVCLRLPLLGMLSPCCDVSVRGYHIQWHIHMESFFLFVVVISSKLSPFSILLYDQQSEKSV